MPKWRGSHLTLMQANHSRLDQKHVLHTISPPRETVSVTVNESSTGVPLQFIVYPTGSLEWQHGMAFVRVSGFVTLRCLPSWPMPLLTCRLQSDILPKALMIFVLIKSPNLVA